jgi:LacI family transcriptional regulator
MRNKVTVQGIADQLGLSRNTVSKALNNHRGIAEETRDIILGQAKTMGYKKLKWIPGAEDERAMPRMGNIVTVTHEHFVDTSYWSIVSRGVADTLGRAGYNLIFDCVKEDDEKSLGIPKSVSTHNADGLLILGSLRAEYIRKILGSGLPTVFVDRAMELSGTEWMRDTVLMENESSVYRIARFLIEQGHTRLGFIGDIGFCRSYYERWLGFKRALDDCGVTPDRDFLLVDPMPRRFQELEEIREKVRPLKRLPTAFICANDRTAILLMKILREKGAKIPEDIAVSGFDNIFESEVVEPHLTTVNIFKEEIGRRAAEQLIWRLKNPERPAESVYIATEVVYRESTAGRRLG